MSMFTIFPRYVASQSVSQKSKAKYGHFILPLSITFSMKSLCCMLYDFARRVEVVVMFLVHIYQRSESPLVDTLVVQS